MEEQQQAAPEAAPEAAPAPAGAPAPDAKDIEENKGITILSYIGILCLIPLLAKKDSKFAQYHAKQGLVLLICEVVTYIVYVIPVIGWIVGFLASIFWLVLAIIGIVNVVKGETKELPVIGKLGAKINL